MMLYMMNGDNLCVKNSEKFLVIMNAYIIPPTE